MRLPTGPHPMHVEQILRDVVRNYPRGGSDHERAIRAAIVLGWRARISIFDQEEEKPMSGPYGTPEPPAVLITWNGKGGVWVATAIAAEAPIEVVGPSSSSGETPAEALQAMLARRFCALTDADWSATLVELIAPAPVEREPLAATR